jgi:phage terminase large subunit-like protein
VFAPVVAEVHRGCLSGGQARYQADPHGRFEHGRKNGKSQLAAALALCHLCGPEAESRGEIYSCANDRFQSGRIFNEMVALISRHPTLSARTNITSFRKEIHDLVNGSIYVALTAETKTKLGLSP